MVDDSIFFEVEYYLIDAYTTGTVTGDILTADWNDVFSVTINELELKEFQDITTMVRDGLEEPVLRFNSNFITDTSKALVSG